MTDGKRTLGGIATHNNSGFKFRFEVLVWLKPGTVIRVGPDMVLINADDYAKGEPYWLALPVESYDMPRKMRQHLKPNPVGLKSVPVEQAAEIMADRMVDHAEQTAPQHAAIARVVADAALRHVPTPSARAELARIRRDEELRQAQRRGVVLHTGDLVPGPSEHRGLQHNAGQRPVDVLGGEPMPDQQFVDDPDRPGTSVLVRRQPGDPRSHTQILLDMRAAQKPEERPDVAGHVEGVLMREAAKAHLLGDGQAFLEAAKRLLKQSTAREAHINESGRTIGLGDKLRGAFSDFAPLDEAGFMASLPRLESKPAGPEFPCTLHQYLPAFFDDSIERAKVEDWGGSFDQVPWLAERTDVERYEWWDNSSEERTVWMLQAFLKTGQNIVVALVRDE